MEQQEVKGDAITPESNPIAYTLSVTTPTEVVAVVNNPEIKLHARPTYELTRNVFFVGFMGAGKTSVARRLARTAASRRSTWTPTSSAASGGRINQIFAEQAASRRSAPSRPRSCDELSLDRRSPIARLVRRRRRPARGEPQRFLPNRRFRRAPAGHGRRRPSSRVADESTPPAVPGPRRPRDRRCLARAACLYSKASPDVAIDTAGKTVTVESPSEVQRASRRRKACCASDEG